MSNALQSGKAHLSGLCSDHVLTHRTRAHLDLNVGSEINRATKYGIGGGGGGGNSYKGLIRLSSVGVGIQLNRPVWYHVAGDSGSKCS